ncbi:PREDICTED: uncharacterized protein LOC108353975 [Rhagoletis zephyria]|uniref:uncharacterized protein LOC108353975 n=1 Tax=Rhagoletis zephyria TaxID=28612 RepID=UPI0008118ED6|nr:PREDICTED: uncharacterized protein LOC108353975 [Rhagoletis zephyria]
MDHFSSEDFENSLKYQMGFAKKRALKRGVVPTIYKKQIKNPERIERAHRRENKMIVAELLQRHETSTSYKENEVQLSRKKTRRTLHFKAVWPKGHQHHTKALDTIVLHRK